MCVCACVCACVCVQLSGINAVFYYSTGIFESIFPDSADVLTVSIGALNVLMTFVAAAAMDRAGRRTLLILCVRHIPTHCAPRHPQPLCAYQSVHA
jgi:hypothetical protein